MSTNRDLNYSLYVQKERGFTRVAFRSEFERYAIISAGDVDGVKKYMAEVKKNFFAGKGELSDNPVRNVMYHFVVSVAMVCRVCVEAGMKHDVAYTLSDIYIRKGDKTNTVEGLIDLLEEMQLDFAGRMRELQKEDAYSIHIRKSVDYIQEHLQEKLSVKEIAERIGLSTDYYAKLFYKEMGVSVKDYVAETKISTAANMLIYSDYSYTDIALTLGYSSQSAFISVFKKYRGITPKEYRRLHYKKKISEIR